jgi:maleylacetoacetate isomerase
MNLLYDYFRSSCSYRVRIALNLKKIPYESIPISLLKREQYSDNYQKINPMASVPTWKDEHIVLTQSLAILEYLEEQYPKSPKIFPTDIIQKAKAREIAYIIACDIHPLNNLRVKEYLGNHQFSEQEILDWYHYWLNKGFHAIETLITASSFCLNDSITIADICLIPQVYNALRFKLDMRPYPKILAIYEHCNTIPAFHAAKPET